MKQFADKIKSVWKILQKICIPELESPEFSEDTLEASD